mmetsp:Transcript_30566/g.99707  ORF Transcript_30566/g.99707 Transcript_30566/m.99707 type:complete len:137 (-) Transcript_30566:797-1207(-)
MFSSLAARRPVAADAATARAKLGWSRSAPPERKYSFAHASITCGSTRFVRDSSFLKVWPRLWPRFLAEIRSRFGRDSVKIRSRFGRDSAACVTGLSISHLAGAALHEEPAVNVGRVGGGGHGGVGAVAGDLRDEPD